MITPKMTYQEIADIFKKEFLEEVKRGYDTCFGQSDKLARAVRKFNSDKFHYYGSHTKVTQQMNEFVVLYFSRDKPINRMAMIRRTVYMRYRLSDGIHIATAHPNTLDKVTFYTPHFFDRYRERGLRKPEMQKNDVINHFMAITAATHIENLDNPKYSNSVFATNEEGVLLGENLGNGLFEFRTFISIDMLKNEQWLRSLLQQEANIEMKERIDDFNRLLLRIGRK